MSDIYLRECLIENLGPISAFDVRLELEDSGNPKPVVLVGKNGTGKTIVLAYILDALAELAKRGKFRDVVVGQQTGHSPYIKIASGGDIRSVDRGGVALLEFSGGEKRFSYVEKVGKVESVDLVIKLGDRFLDVRSALAAEELQKKTAGPVDDIATFFQDGSICFFPSSRHERPHWLNVEAINDESLFGGNRRITGVLGKPLIVESAGADNLQWLMSVLFDSLIEADLEAMPQMVIGGDPVICCRPTSSLSDKLLLNVARQNVERLLRSILEDDQARFVLNYRNASHGRIAIRLGSGVTIPSCMHLSAGQALLFNLFMTVIRYADSRDLHKSVRLHEINGIVVIDEVDAHLHTDLQYEVLPRLFKLFPRIQFILTSHAPLFLLGMEREFGVDGVQILEMPRGQKIGTERFEEFLQSFEYYCRTRAFEDEIGRQVLAANKPLVLTEGHTDVTYIRTALELLGHGDLLELSEIDEVGTSNKDGTKGGGHANLEAARKFLENNQRRFARHVLLLYDCDTQKPPGACGRIMVRSVPANPLNSKVTRGTENLLPLELFTEAFYEEKRKETGYGGETIVREFRKTAFCKWVCEERREKSDFQQFEALLVPILQEFLAATVSADR
jgi:hypothetical protein